jgi:short-subunit dehydrogenase
VRLYGEGLAGTLAHTGVKVHVICPGFVESRMTAVNTYNMPFLMSAEKAAGIIERGIAAGRGRIAFPLRAYAMVQFLNLLPDGAAQALLARTPQKSAS